MSGSISVHKCSCHLYVPEYGFGSLTLVIYAHICICETSGNISQLAFDVMGCIGTDLVVAVNISFFYNVLLDF